MHSACGAPRLDAFCRTRPYVSGQTDRVQDLTTNAEGCEGRRLLQSSRSSDRLAGRSARSKSRIYDAQTEKARRSGPLVQAGRTFRRTGPAPRSPTCRRRAASCCPWRSAPWCSASPRPSTLHSPGRCCPCPPAFRSEPFSPPCRTSSTSFALRTRPLWAGRFRIDITNERLRQVERPISYASNERLRASRCSGTLAFAHANETCTGWTPNKKRRRDGRGTDEYRSSYQRAES